MVGAGPLVVLLFQTHVVIEVPEPFGMKAIRLFGQTARHEPMEGQTSESSSILGQSAIYKEIE